MRPSPLLVCSCHDPRRDVVLFCRLMNHEMSQEFACRDDTVVVHFVTKVWPFSSDRHAVSFENSFCVSHRSKGHDGISLAMMRRKAVSSEFRT